MFYTMSGVNNVHLFMINGIDIFPGNKSCWQNCHKKDVSKEKPVPEAVKRWN